MSDPPAEDEPTTNGDEEDPAGDAPGGAAPSGTADALSGLAPQPQAVRAALATLPVPQPNERFWNQLELAVQDEPPMQIMPRPAIRPITQPPPRSGGDVVEDVFERGGHRGKRGRRFAPIGRKRTSPELGLGAGGRSSRLSGLQRLLVLVGIAVLVGLAALGGLFDDGSEDRTSTDAGNRADQGEAEGDPASPDEGGEEGSEGSEPGGGEEEEPEPPSPRGLAVDVPLHAGGLGPLQPGLMTLRNVAEVTGVDPEFDQQAFEFSGGRCYEAHVPGAEDVTLSVRSRDAAQGVEDPYDGVVVALVVASSPGSFRATDAGVTLGTTEEQLEAAYVDAPLRRAQNPYHADGGVYIAADPNSENAVAYFTGFSRVIEIRVGHEPLIGRTRLCE